MALEATDGNFEELVLKADKPVIVDFWAEWCGPCKMLTPVIEEIAGEYADKAVICKVNTDDHREAAVEYAINASVNRSIHATPGTGTEKTLIIIAFILLTILPIIIA